MKQSYGMAPEDFALMHKRYPDGITLWSDGVLDWGFPRGCLFVAYDAGNEELIIMQGSRTERACGPNAAIEWQSVVFLPVHAVQSLIPFRDYLDHLIGGHR